MSRDLGVARSRATALIDALVGKGRAERHPDPHDARIRVIALTRSGQQKLDAVRTYQATVHEQVLRKMTAKEPDQILTCLEKLKYCMELVKEELEESRKDVIQMHFSGTGDVDDLEPGRQIQAKEFGHLQGLQGGILTAKGNDTRSLGLCAQGQIQLALDAVILKAHNLNCILRTFAGANAAGLTGNRRYDRLILPGDGSVGAAAVAGEAKAAFFLIHYRPGFRYEFGPVSKKLVDLQGCIGRIDPGRGKIGHIPAPANHKDAFTVRTDGEAMDIVLLQEI